MRRLMMLVAAALGGGSSCRAVAVAGAVCLSGCGVGVAGDFLVEGDGGTCVPQCEGRVCGPDGCGGNCGTCAGGSCNTGTGQCNVGSCVPQCSGKVCGPDGCGGSCGTCSSGTCNGSGQCPVACTPVCSGKACGSNGCGGSCGTCSQGNVCSNTYTCVPLASVPLNLVFFGNSFTQCWGGDVAFGNGYGDYGVGGLVKSMATAKGFPTPRIQLELVGGTALSDHINSLVRDGGVQHPGGYEWNVVVLQEISDGPTSAGNVSAFRANAATLLGLMRQYSPSATGLLYETWAYAAGNSWYGYSGVSTPAAMQAQLKSNYQACLADLETAHPGMNKIAYVGEVFRTQSWASWLYSPSAADLKHPSDQACYLAALEIFTTIYGAAVDGLPPLLSDISTTRAAELQQMVSTLQP